MNLICFRIKFKPLQYLSVVFTLREHGERFEEHSFGIGVSRGKTSKNASTVSQSSLHSSTTVHAPLSRLAEKTSVHLTSNPLITSDAITATSQHTSAILTDANEQMKSKLDFVNGADNEQLEYLLLSQEEYLEHHSEVTQCKFSSSSGYLIASSDVEGVIKVWSAGPPGPPHTVATFISNSSVTSLEWMPHSDTNFIYGTTSGNIRICDQSQRKTRCDINVNTDQYLAYGNSQGHDNSLSIEQIAISTSGTSLAASICSKSKYKVNTPSDTNDGSLVLYDLRTSTRLEEYDFSNSLLRASNTNFGNVVTSLTFNHNSQILTTGSSDGKVRIFDLRKRGDCISSWSVNSNDVSPIVTLHPSIDDTSIYTLSEDGCFSVWSIVQTSRKVFGGQIEDQYFTSGM